MRASHRNFLLPVLLATAVAVPALAQTGNAPLTNYPACNTTPNKQDSDQAHEAFKLGKRFFDEADYGSAIHNFVDAYKLDCTKTELLTIIARAFELNGNKADAVHALETYLERAQSASAEDKAQIQKRIDNLKALIAAQTPVPTAAPAAPVPVEPAAPPPPPPPPPPEERHHTAGPWVLTAIGGAALIGGGVLWLIGHGDYTSAQSVCPMNICSGGSSSEESEGNTGHTLMDVGGLVFIGGGALAVGGLLWHFVEPTGPSGDKKASVEPVLAPGYAGIRGWF
jgi:hypothetical protein